MRAAPRARCERRLRPAEAGYAVVAPAGRLRCAAQSAGARPNSLRVLRTLRSDSGRESEEEARAARHPRPCPARHRVLCRPQRGAVAARRHGYGMAEKTRCREVHDRAWVGLAARDGMLEIPLSRSSDLPGLVGGVIPIDPMPSLAFEQSRHSTRTPDSRKRRQTDGRNGLTLGLVPYQRRTRHARSRCSNPR